MFDSYEMNERGREQLAVIHDAFNKLLAEVHIIDNGRERSLMLTKLQEACWYARRSIALDVKNQKVKEFEGR